MVCSSSLLSFLRGKTYLNISEVNRKIFKCPHSCDWLLLTIQVSENSPWESQWGIRDKMYVSLRWRVVLFTRTQIQIDQSELSMKPSCERPSSHVRSQGCQESRRGEFQGEFFVLHESFGRRNTCIWSEIYWALWNCYFYRMRFGTFPVGEKAICRVTSGQR